MIFKVSCLSNNPSYLLFKKDHHDMAHTNYSCWTLYEKCDNIPNKVYLYIVSFQPTHIFCINHDKYMPLMLAHYYFLHGTIFIHVIIYTIVFIFPIFNKKCNMYTIIFIPRISSTIPKKKFHS